MSKLNDNHCEATWASHINVLKLQMTTCCYAGLLTKIIYQVIVKCCFISLMFTHRYINLRKSIILRVKFHLLFFFFGIHYNDNDVNKNNLLNTLLQLYKNTLFWHDIVPSPTCNISDEAELDRSQQQ